MSDHCIYNQTIPAMFLRQTAQRPESKAVFDDQESLSYAQLSGLAGGIARAVLEKTGKNEARVCILAPQRIAAVASMLGVLQAGKCFVPMLPQESDDYLRYLWKDSESSLIVCDPEFNDRAASICGSADCVVAASKGMSRIGLAEPHSHYNPEDISAIMYTSGSTGQPKGVMTTRGAILNRALQHVETARVTSSDHQASVVPWQFAASFPDIFAPFLMGATLFLYDNHRSGIDRLGPWLEQNSITLLKLPSALVRRFIENVSVDHLTSVRHVYIGGGGIKMADAKSLLDLLPEKAALIHGFGSTETNLLACRQWHGDTPAFQTFPAQANLPAGYPVAGKKILIVDDKGNPVPSGDEGELVAVGRDLFGGYWRQPEMTAQCMQELSNGERVYHTGDIARIREDGSLEILGRKGQRIKIRGLRIDLEAVASLLRSLPYIRDAAAVAFTSSKRNARLVAYLETAEGDPVTATTVREDLKKKAPGYMIPSRFVMMRTLPRTGNGKIDRCALPSPGRMRPAMANPYVRPRTPLENRLADVWAEVLGIDEIGIHDDFLELGGDSLLALELETRLQHELEIKEPISRLLFASTVAQMAQMIEVPESSGRLSLDVKIPFRWRLKYFRRNITNSRINASPRIEPFLPSYECFLRLQKLWVSSPLARFFLRREIHTFKEWLRLTAQTDDNGQLMRHNLMANSWYVARNFLLTQQKAFEHWISTAGWDHVQSVATAGKGIILVFPHTRVFFSCIRERLTEKIFPESYFLGVGDLPPDGSNRTALLVERLKEAGNVLARGGAVWIAGDGLNGTIRIVVTQYGRRFPFRSGAAELAVRSGVPLLPVFPTLRPDGGIKVVFSPPLDTPRKGSWTERVEELMRKYAEIYVDFWPCILPNIRTHRQFERLHDTAGVVFLEK